MSVERGQVGIGTLIVFIAMVLVAAIASGVLITTTGYLQNSAEVTGQEASSQATDRIVVVSATGDHITSDDAVGVINLTVAPAPGAGNVDLRNTTVQWVGPSGVNNQVASSISGANPDGRFAVSAMKDADDSEPVLNDQDDRMVLTFDVGSRDLSKLSNTDTFGEEVGEGESVTITLVTGSGGQLTTEITVPESLSGRTSVVL